MDITEAIGHLTNDLERFATSGKASPKAIAFRQAVLNTVIDAINAAEEKTAQQRTALRSRIEALEHDVQDRDDRIGMLKEHTSLNFSWSHFEGRAQRALNYMLLRVEREEGRSMAAEHAEHERGMLGLLRDEFNKLYDAMITLGVRVRQQREHLAHLRQWCLVCGVDLAQFDAFPEPWLRHLPEAVRAADERRLADGLIDAKGVRRRAAYLNPNAVAYSVLSAVAIDAQFKEACAARGIDLPASSPAWTWAPDNLKEEPARVAV